MKAQTQLTITLPAPHAGQQKVLASSKRFNVVCCGRRFGKSTLGIDRIVKPALAGMPTAWFSPGYKLLLDSWRELQKVLEPVIVSRNNAEYRLELRGGGSITMFSLDADTSDSTRGRAYSLIVIDECGLVKNLRQVWENTIRPCLADYRGDAWFLSTPRGMNDFKMFFDRGQDPEREDWASWQMTTASNPFIDPAEIAAARSEMSEGAFNQEFLAEFLSWEGAVFRNIQACATAEPQDAPVDGHAYCIGADWGKSNDFTCFVVLDVTERVMVALDRSNRIDYSLQRARLQALYQKWRPSRIICESNSIGGPILEELQRSGLPVQGFTTSNSSKAEIVESLALAFEQGTISILPDPVLMGELQSFQSERLPSGLTRYGAPGASHDDTVIALAIAWTACRPTERALYRHVMSDDIFYDDSTRPSNLSSPRGAERWVIVCVTENRHVYAELFDDGCTLWVEHEYDCGQKSEPEHIDDLINGAGEWPGLGEQPRRRPAVLIDPEAATFRTQLLAHGVFVLDARDGNEDGIRRTATMLSQKKLRIHKRCSAIRREMEAATWDDVTTTAGKKRPDPIRDFVATRIGNWRLGI